MRVTIQELRHSYSQARRLAEQRSRRLEAAGFRGYHAPRIRDLEPGDLKKELKKLQWFNESEQATVRGARARQAAEKIKAEEAAERRRERDRGYYKKKVEAQGREYKPRPPKLSEDEQRARKRERDREYKRQYRQRIKERERDFVDFFGSLENTSGHRTAQNYKNLLSGLRKHGIKVNSVEELEAWMKYIQSRSDNRKKDEYLFQQWLDDLNNATDKKHATPEMIYTMIEDFENYKADQEVMRAEFMKPRSKDEYTEAQMGDIWSMYMGSKYYNK